MTLWWYRRPLLHVLPRTNYRGGPCELRLPIQRAAERVSRRRNDASFMAPSFLTHVTASGTGATVGPVKEVWDHEPVSQDRHQARAGTDIREVSGKRGQVRGQLQYNGKGIVPNLYELDGASETSYMWFSTREPYLWYIHGFGKTTPPSQGRYSRKNSHEKPDLFTVQCSTLVHTRVLGQITPLK